MIIEKKITTTKTKEEWFSMKNQLDSGCQGRVPHVPRHQWRIFLMAIIDAYEGLDIMVLDVPTIFIHTKMPPNKYVEEKVIMKIRGVLLDMLL